IVKTLHVASAAVCVSPTPDINSAEPAEFRGSSGVTVGTDHPLSKAAFLHLAAVWPQALSFAALLAESHSPVTLGTPRTQDETSAEAGTAPPSGAVGRIGNPSHEQASDGLARDADLLAENLLQAYCAGVSELHVLSSVRSTVVGERPRAPAYARLQAKD